jgi:hypothetical protein
VATAPPSADSARRGAGIRDGQYRWVQHAQPFDHHVQPVDGRLKKSCTGSWHGRGRPGIRGGVGGQVIPGSRCMPRLQRSPHRVGLS